MRAWDVRLAKHYGPNLGLPRGERIAVLKAEADFLARAIKVEEADAEYAARARVNRVNYRQHLESHYWQRLRAYKCIAASWKCEECGCQAGLTLELHHPTYDPLGYEEIGDVVALCRKCHEKAHGMMRVTVTAPA
jgi:hypothetical protein